jgi:uncharacterized protein (TIGR02186 family)
MNVIRLGLVAFAAAGWPATWVVDPDAAQFRLHPEVIQMTAFYSGVKVRLDGSVQNGDEVVVVIRGPDLKEVFNRKERIGPIWISRGKVHVSGIPSLFLSFSRSPVNKLLSRDEIEKHGLGEAAVRRQIRIEPVEYDSDTIRDHYFAIKAKEGTYRAQYEGIKLGVATGQQQVPFAIEFDWPRKAPPAVYGVAVSVCRNGSVLKTSTLPLNVIKAGFPAWLSALSEERAPVYGVLSILVAVSAGFGIDFVATAVFGKRPVRGH